MSTRNLPTPPPEAASETPTEASTESPTETDRATPPTTSAEEATTSTNPPSAQPQPTQIHTIYREVFHICANKAIDKDWSGLTTLAELHDLRTEHDADASRLLLTTPLVLAYLILDDIPPARFALTRLPPPLLHHPLTERLFNLLASTSERNYPQVYIRAKGLSDVLSTDVDLDAFGPSMVKSFVASFRMRAFNLISKAYTTIPVSLAEAYLGLTRDELLPTVTRHKWKYDPATDILTPAHPQSTNARHIQGFVPGPSTLFTFDAVTNGVALLES